MAFAVREGECGGWNWGGSWVLVIYHSVYRVGNRRHSTVREHNSFTRSFWGGSGREGSGGRIRVSDGEEGGACC